MSNTIDLDVSDLIAQRLAEEKRVISIKLPSYGEVFTNHIQLADYTLYYWDEHEKKLRFTPRTNRFIKLGSLVIESVLFAVQCIFSLPVSPLTAFTLMEKMGGVAYSFARDKSGLNNEMLQTITKHIKIRSRVQNEYKKIKKVLYINLDNNSSAQIFNTALLLADLINQKYIVDVAIVILSKTVLFQPQQEELHLRDTSGEDAEFINCFGRELLNLIRQERYSEATSVIGNFIVSNGVEDPDKFNFTMQCLSFCYKKLNEADFRALFSACNLSNGAEIDFGKNKNFIENSKMNSAFLSFCFACFEKHYRNIVGVHSHKYEAQFLLAVKTIKQLLDDKNEYYIAAQLFSKFGHTEESVSAFIIAYVHSQYINNQIGDEILTVIESYSSASTVASLFVELVNLNNMPLPDESYVRGVWMRINDLDLTDPLLDLCFCFYLVNPIYKSGIIFAEFLKHYLKAYVKLHKENRAFRCLFGAQILPFYATIEDIDLHNQYAKTAAAILQNVQEDKYLLKNKIAYYRICRSINGIMVDCFHENLALMLQIKDGVASYYKENLFYQLNLGVMYAYCLNFSAAIKIYKKIHEEQIETLPNDIRLNYLNNICVFQYLNNPTASCAKKQYTRCDRHIKSVPAELEEKKHLTINRFLFALLGEAPYSVIEACEQDAYAICDDNYFKFYLQQAIWLKCILFNSPFPCEPIQTSVFFMNKKSFFEQKYMILSKEKGNESHSIQDINTALMRDLSSFDKNYEYFKNAAVFSLVERWFE